MHSALISLKLQICLDLIFTYRKLLQCLFTVGSHKCCCCICDLLLIIICNFYIIVCSLFFHDVHQLYIFQRLFYCLFSIGLSVFCIHAPDRIILSAHKALIHCFCLCLSFSYRKTHDSKRNFCSIHCCNCFCSI